ncbi:MAG: 23S rRNA (adenine(2503)-C(2))-methyltransferase RlmN [Candidatus Izimaplasma sp.]|nr:23S rRNA (adenine(2503)-C(2))-methyltransferase RlmN [Candidatus Izimaplasma bacterium]
MNNLFNYTLNNLETHLVENGFKTFNARQVFDWIYKKGGTNFDQMSNLSKPLRAYLNKSFLIEPLTVVSHQISSDVTEKFLFRLSDGQVIETVLMKHNYGNSICVTSQIGCNMGCSFCASGLYKKTRDLTRGEMVQQIVTVKRLIKKRISHVVVMGIGEPFENYDHTMAFIDIINSPYGLEIGARHITVSTSGIVPRIYDFAKDPKQVNLAISLHAPNNALRTKIMTINKVYPIEKLLKAVHYYIKETNRRVTFEYILLAGVNDDLKYADELSNLLRGINCYVNLIRYNPVDEFNYKGTPNDQAKAFHDRLMKRGITATLRHEKGGDIDAACGQLRSKDIKGNG